MEEESMNAMIGEDRRYVETSDREIYWRNKYAVAVERFKLGQEGEATFRKVLLDLGFRGQEVYAEISLALMERERALRQKTF
jgi:hypothetical protein